MEITKMIFTNMNATITEASTKITRPSLGGYLVESGVHTGVIKAAYFSNTKAGGKMVNLEIDFNGTKVTVREFIMQMGADGNLTNLTGNGTTYRGYTSIDNLCYVVTGKQLHMQPALETKHIEMWNAELKQRVPTPVEMIVSLVNQSVVVAMVKQIEDKTRDSGNKDAKGKAIYIPTGETRETNSAEHWFRASDKLHASEIMYGKSDADKSFADAWDEINKGKTRNRATASNSGTGTPAASPASASGTPVAAPEVDF